ncbi:MAG: reverse transcriptase domain-containing protein [Candidatus Thiodiazotropha taylori]|nr:hypothetical protein [Candidatus Thiodiazotropha taylori]MCW4285293.1 reverse transcriptase domain-containing protein [Candidatus Thiodiazotropha taylori]
MWIQIEKCLTNTDENVMLGISYVPPFQSKYYNDEEMLNLEREITSVCSNNKYIYLTGDLNARTARLEDYTRADTFLSDMFDYDTETRSFFDKVSILENYNIPTDRASKDNKTNNTGRWLAEVCKNNNLFIVNGRVGKDKYEGAPTFKDKSVIDYTISTAECFSFIAGFEIIDLDPLFSDGHALISWSLHADNSKKFGNSDSQDECSHTNFTKFKWSDGTKQAFIEQFDLADVSDFKQNIDAMVPSLENVNASTKRISDMFDKAAKESLKPIKRTSHNRTFDKPWFGPACKAARKEYHKARRMYQSNKCIQYKNNLQTQSKNFKNVMIKYIHLYRIHKAKKLRNMQNKNPKAYWKYVNSINKNITQTKQPTLDQFYKHFRNINETINDDTAENTILNMQLNDTNEILNSHITCQEIKKCINNLKNAKSPGGDQILNEYLKSTKEIFLPVYETLFNKVFDSGILPTAWLEGSITPIYKNKGDSSDPVNYRPITILSCLGKVFTAVLNNRLTAFLDNSNILNENQAGFRKHYSTLDHSFVLSSLIEILKIKKTKTLLRIC